MVIQKVGDHCFKITAGSVTIAVSPPSPRSKLKVNKFGSNLVLIPLRHPDWDGTETASHGDKEPFVIQGPGAYEVGEITVSGFATPSNYGSASEFGNTVYVFDMDGIKVLSLGALSSTKLPQDLRAEVDDVGIVLLPVGDGTLDPREAHELMVAIEPHVIIPFGVGSDGEKAVAAFVKAEGEAPQKEEKLTIRSKEVAAMDGTVVLLS